MCLRTIVSFVPDRKGWSGSLLRFQQRRRRLILARAVGRQLEDAAVLFGGLRGVAALLIRNAQIQHRFDEARRAGERALEPGHGVRGAMRLDEQHAQAVGGVGGPRVGVERLPVGLFGARAFAGVAARVAEIRPVRRVRRIAFRRRCSNDATASAGFDRATSAAARDRWAAAGFDGSSASAACSARAASAGMPAASAATARS